MTTAWSHLPNAQHIDAVLAHVKLHPEKWNAAWDAARDAAWGAARGAAWDAARDAAWNAAWNAAWDAAWGAAWGAARDAAWGAAWGAARGAAWDAAWGAAWGAIAALIAYDECAHYLTMPVGALNVAVSAGIPAAVLLKSANVAMNNNIQN